MLLVRPPAQALKRRLRKQEVASALDLCVEKDNFDTDSDRAIESGEEDSYIDV